MWVFGLAAVELDGPGLAQSSSEKVINKEELWQVALRMSMSRNTT
jgi:hypothetical protein